jgi:NAD(P)H-hydrate repair Nnr-like enzyme with NAD(P)H-hydrate dehydratase domain
MDYWYKQTHDQPLFPDLEWEKPERKDQAGKLLIVGGNLHGFAAPAKADEIAKQQGIGATRIVLPDALRKTLGHLWIDAVFAPSTPSGSFAVEATDPILQNLMWADGVLLAGDLGRNSQTALLLETLIRTTSVPLGITKDALDYFTTNAMLLLDRADTLVVGSFAQIQKLLSHSEHPLAITYDMQLSTLVELLSELTKQHPAHIVTKFHDYFVVACGGNVSTTQDSREGEVWRLDMTARAIVNLLHFPAKPFAALTRAASGR